MKIIELIPTLHLPGGAQTFVASLVKSFSTMSGVSVEIISLYNESGFINKELEKQGIVIHYLDKKRGLDLRVGTDLRKLIKKIKPDIIHVHLNSVISIFLSGVLFDKKRHFKTFYTVHSVASKDAKKVAGFILKYLFKRKLIIPMAISNNIALTIKDKYGINQIETIYNGIDVSNFYCDLKLSLRPRDFIHIGSFINVKNHSFLIKSFSEFIKLRPNSNLTLVGDGPLQDSIKDLVSSYGLNNHVLFLGIRKDVNLILREHKYFVLPSLYEGNPMSVLEAMSSGLPIIASKTGGISDVIKAPDNGFLFPVNSMDDFVKHMVYLVDNPAISQKISEDNIIEAKKHDIMHNAKQHYNLFARHIAKTKN